MRRARTGDGRALNSEPVTGTIVPNERQNIELRGTTGALSGRDDGFFGH